MQVREGREGREEKEGREGSGGWSVQCILDEYTF